MPSKNSRVRIPDLLKMKAAGSKIAMLTAYDATMARLLDRAGLDVLLVGDSLGMVVLGYETTIPVTLDAMVHHTAAVSRGARRALVVADMPFLAAQISPAEALVNAGRLIQEGGAAAVKIEGCEGVEEAIRVIVEAGIPVMAHLGLTPQSVHQLGGYRTVGKTDREAERLRRNAEATAAAGAFALVLECVPEALAGEITRSLAIPTIGIGSGPQCDGQVLVSYDAFGLFDDLVPPFVKRYADLGTQMTEAARQYLSEVRDGSFPAARPAPKTAK
jgi:3-methyl-2-oxobutanoate hydroxymethyltransferase